MKGTKSSDDVGEARSQGGTPIVTSDGGYFSRYPNLKFPKFDGTNVRSWLRKCGSYFSLEEVPLQHMMSLAVMHMEGKALIWYIVWSKSREGSAEVEWEEFGRAVSKRFSESTFDDPMYDLLCCHQDGSVMEYLADFETKLGRVSGLAANHCISIFLKGLKPEISLQVRMFSPTTLAHASHLARLQEHAIGVNQRKTEEFNQQAVPARSPTNVNCNQRRHKPRGRFLSCAEIDERREQGLCIWCNEKYTREHKCANKGEVYLVEVSEEESVEAVEDGMELLFVKKCASVGSLWGRP